MTLLQDTKPGRAWPHYLADVVHSDGRSTVSVGGSEPCRQRVEGCGLEATSETFNLIHI